MSRRATFTNASVCRRRDEEIIQKIQLQSSELWTERLTVIRVETIQVHRAGNPFVSACIRDRYIRRSKKCIRHQFVIDLWVVRQCVSVSLSISLLVVFCIIYRCTGIFSAYIVFVTFDLNYVV